MIYFIRQDASVKIGCTQNIKARLAELQVSNPNKLSVMLLIPGSYEEEQSLHRLFVDDKIRGEWYFLSDDINDFIRSNYNNDFRYDEGLSDDLDDTVKTRFIRNLNNLNLREMGEKLNITPQSIKEIETREMGGAITINVLKRYGEVLGYDFKYNYVKQNPEDEI